MGLDFAVPSGCASSWHCLANDPGSRLFIARIILLLLRTPLAAFGSACCSIEGAGVEMQGVTLGCLDRGEGDHKVVAVYRSSCFDVMAHTVGRTALAPKDRPRVIRHGRMRSDGD